MFKKKKTESIEDILDKEEGYTESTVGQGEVEENTTNTEPQEKVAKKNTNTNNTQGMGLFEVEEGELPDLEEEETEKGKGKKVAVLCILGVCVLGLGIGVISVLNNNDDEIAPADETPVEEVVVDNSSEGKEGLYVDDEGNEIVDWGVVVDGGEIKNADEVTKEEDEKVVITDELTVEDVPVGGLTEYDKEVIRSEKFIKYKSEYANIDFEHSDTWYVNERSHEGIEIIQQAVGSEEEVSTFSLNKKKLVGVLPIVDFVLPNGGETMVMLQVGSEVERDKVLREQAKASNDVLYLATIPPVTHVKIPTSFAPMGEAEIKIFEEEIKAKKDVEQAELKEKEKDKEKKATYTKLSDAYNLKGTTTKKLGKNTYTLKKYYFNVYGTPYMGYELSTKIGDNSFYVMLYGMQEENLESSLYRVEKLLISLNVK